MYGTVRSDPKTLLTSAVDAFVAFFAEAPPAALGEAMIDCRRQIDRLEAGFTQAAGRFATNREYAVEGKLDPEGGAMLQTALNALMHPLPGDTRRADQRRADALVELCRRQLDSGSLPETGRQKPHLSVTVSAAALAALPGTEGGELNWAGTVPAATVQRLACDASLSVIALDQRGLPLDVGRATRS